MSLIKTKIVALSASALAMGMAKGAIIYNYVNQHVSQSDSFTFALDGVDPSFEAFFDGGGAAAKPCILGANNNNGNNTYPGSFPNPIPTIFNELDMNPVSPASNDNNGIPVIPFGTTITTQITVGAETLTVSDLGGDTHGKNEGYLNQNGETTTVGQWPNNADTYGYVALAMVNTNVTPYTTNYGWVHLELNYIPSSPYMTVIDYGYQSIAGSNILAGQEGPIAIPAIYQAPTNQTAAAGITVNMSVVAMGDPSPGYQWMAGTVGSHIYTNLPNAGVYSGANTPNLTISGITPAQHLDYVVAVTNINGSVTSSPPATLTVFSVGLTGPVPPRQIIYAGYPAQFNIIDTVGVTVTNQWELSGTNLTNGGTFSGVGTTNLQISSVNPSDLGNYLAVASTAYGAVTSSVASLGIVYPDGTRYESTVLADGAVDYYRLDETSGTNAWDFIGGNNGTYGSDAVFGATGPTAVTGFPGFASTNYCATFTNGDPNNLLPCLPWNVNTNAMTITAWIYPNTNSAQTTEGNAGIVYTVGTDNFACGLRYDGSYTNHGNVDGDIGYNWGNVSGTFNWDSGITAPENQWSLVALAISASNATIYIINPNGIQSATNSVANLPQLFNATEYIGTYPAEGSLGINNFIGNIDEVGIFNSTLSPNQIMGLYNAAVNFTPLTISKVGGNLQLQWSGGGALLQATNLLGPWITNSAATSPYILNPTIGQEFFQIQQ